MYVEHIEMVEKGSKNLILIEAKPGVFSLQISDKETGEVSAIENLCLNELKNIRLGINMAIEDEFQ